NQRQNHPNDADRVYGGNLAFTRQSDFDRPRPEPRFTIAHDVTQQVQSVAPEDQWIAQLAVGRLRGADGFTGSAQAVGTALAQCTASSQMYTPYEQELRITDGKAITVPGPGGAEVTGWRVDADIRVDYGPSFGGDKVVFVVVPDGKDWGMFFGAVPLGDPTMAAQLDDVVGSLRTT
ncbi:MAG: hypothetical protein L0G99_02810, partial [Propionibacteriales bacterium]|nr:hypothetical protein [Propionibacteriales bacterium]